MGNEYDYEMNFEEAATLADHLKGTGGFVSSWPDFDYPGAIVEGVDAEGHSYVVLTTPQFNRMVEKIYQYEPPEDEEYEQEDNSN